MFVRLRQPLAGYSLAETCRQDAKVRHEHARRPFARTELHACAFPQRADGASLLLFPSARLQPASPCDAQEAETKQCQRRGLGRRLDGESQHAAVWVFFGGRE